MEYAAEIPMVNPTIDSVMGLDYSSESLYVDHMGNQPDYPRYYRKAEAKLKKEQRKLSKRKKGGKNREKQRQKVAKLHEKVANQRKDFLHKLSRQITNAYDAVAIEDINMRNIEFDYTLSVGLKAPYELSRLCKEELKKNKGRIINIASSRAFQSEPDTEAYASAKGGIVALTHALAISLGPDVLVNCIAPGWINVTDQQEFGREDCAAIPAGKVGTPKDISDMVLFLCQQDFITGETFTIDGGMSKRMIYHGDWNWYYKLENN